MLRDTYLQIAHQQQDALLQGQQQDEELAAGIKEERGESTLGTEIGGEDDSQERESEWKANQKRTETA